MTRLRICNGICHGNNKGTEDGGGGEGHALQPHTLGTWDKCPHPKLPSIVWDWEETQQYFILRGPDLRRFKS